MMGRIVLRVAAVDALALVEHELADDVRLALLELGLDELLVLGATSRRRARPMSVSASFFLSVAVAVVARLLVDDAGGLAEIARRRAPRRAP